MDNAFIDTNIWIYALVQEKKNVDKHLKAIELLEKLRLTNKILISTQVINEFHWVLLRKYNFKDNDILKKVEESILIISDIVPVDFEQYLSSAKIRDKYKLSFWDSIIVASALKYNCKIIYTEDLGHNQLFENKLKIIKPFYN